MVERAVKRPFWLHQLAEYILGAALVASGLQSPTPAAPAVVGGVIVLHAALTKGPLSAFQVLGRRTHRIVDLAVIAFALIVAAQPWYDVDDSARLIILAIALAHAFIWWQSSFVDKLRGRAREAARAEQARSPLSSGSAARVGADTADAPVADLSVQIGPTAGRLVGGGVNMAKRAKAKRDNR